MTLRKKRGTSLRSLETAVLSGDTRGEGEGGRSHVRQGGTQAEKQMERESVRKTGGGMRWDGG